MKIVCVNTFLSYTKFKLKFKFFIHMTIICIYSNDIWSNSYKKKEKRKEQK